MKRYGNVGGGNIDFAQEFEDKFMPRSGWLNTPDTKGSGFSGAQMKELAADPRFLKAVVNSEKLHNGIVGNFESLDDWKKYRDEQTRKGISDYLSDTQNGWGLERGGILHRILSWIMNMFGAGRSDFYKQVGDRIRSIGNPSGPSSQEESALEEDGNANGKPGSMAIIDGGGTNPATPPQPQWKNYVVPNAIGMLPQGMRDDVTGAFRVGTPVNPGSTSAASESPKPSSAPSEQQVAQRPAVRQAPVQRQNVGMNALQNTGSKIKSWFLGGSAPKAPSVPGVKNLNMP